MNDEDQNNQELIEKDSSGLSLELPKSKKTKYTRFIMAALGSIPWIGGFIAGGAALHAEKEQGKVNENTQRWLSEHDEKIRALYSALSSISFRIEELGESSSTRVEEEDYLNLVRKGFRVWDKAETEDKRMLVQRLIINAAGTTVSDDDVIRLFLDWVDKYHESHFAVIRAVYKNPGITLLGIWYIITGSREIPRENSSSADLYRMLIHDLSTGRVLRQERKTNRLGQFLKKPRGPRKPSTDTMKSSFDNEDRYELSELGQDFVHYVLHDAVTKIEA